LAAYFTYTRDLTICQNCSTVEGGRLQACKKCGASGEDLEYWSRVTGYYQRVRGWNSGKVQEFKDRHRYEI